MSRQDNPFIPREVYSFHHADEETVSVLAVGESSEWLRRGKAVPSDGSVLFVSIDDVTDALLRRTSPGVVLSPALSPRFDCIDLAVILHQFGYAGRYRALSRELPNPAMVEREIRLICPGLDFAILGMD